MHQRRSEGVLRFQFGTGLVLRLCGGVEERGVFGQTGQDTVVPIQVCLGGLVQRGFGECQIDPSYPIVFGQHEPQIAEELHPSGRGLRLLRTQVQRQVQLLDLGDQSRPDRPTPRLRGLQEPKEHELQHSAPHRHRLPNGQRLYVLRPVRQRLDQGHHLQRQHCLRLALPHGPALMRLHSQG